jgi:hypothetical protein
MAEGYDVELSDANGEIFTATLYSEDQFERVKRANESGLLKVRTFIIEHNKREV